MKSSKSKRNKRAYYVGVLWIVICITSLLLYTYFTGGKELKQHLPIDKLVKATTSELTPTNEDYPINYAEVIGKASFTYDFHEQGIPYYGGLDNLGRPTYANIIITPELYKKEKEQPREPIKVNPIGWSKNNPKVTIFYRDNTTYKGYLFNRSHLIADSLGGDPIKENLITGTRPQNVGTRKNDGGMAFVEGKIRKYFDDGNNSTVLYEVICNYTEDEIIPRTVTVNVKSSDSKLDEQVIVYNYAEGFVIDYATGGIVQPE